MVGDCQCRQADPCRGDNHLTRRANPVGMRRVHVQISTVTTGAEAAMAEIAVAALRGFGFIRRLAREAVVPARSPALAPGLPRVWVVDLLPGSGIAALGRECR